MSRLRFSSEFDAIQYLAELTDSRIIIAKKFTMELGQKMLEDKYSDDLFLRIIQADPTVKNPPAKLDENTRIDGKFIKQLIEWIKKDKVKPEELDEAKPILKEYMSMKQKQVPEVMNENKMKHIIERGLRGLSNFMENLKNKRPRLEDLFSHMDEKLLSSNGKYRLFRIDDYDETFDTIQAGKWCVRDEDWFRRYDPPFYLITKGNKLYALLNVEGMLETEKIDFDEWLNNYGYDYEDGVIERLKEHYEPDEYDIDQKLQDRYDDYLEYRESEKAELEEGEEEEYTFEEWIEDHPEEVDEVKDELIEEYEPDESEIKENLEQIYYDDDGEYMQIPIPGTGQGIEFNNAGNTKMTESEMKPIVKLLTEGFKEDIPTLQYIFNEYGPDYAEDLVKDPLEFKLMTNQKINIDELSKHPDKQRLKEKYPDPFRELAESKGQQKMFEMASINDALQYLSNLTGKRIIIK